jgi:hypothetical protein
MVNQRRGTADEPQAVTVEALVNTSDEGADEFQQSPYLKVSGPDIGVFEFELPDRMVTIGCSEQADIRFPHHCVSRNHATIRCDDGRYTLENADPHQGIVVNGQRTERRLLAHGDCIVIASYVLEFRTHAELPGAAAAAARAKLLLREEYPTLPSNVQFKYRMLEVAPQGVFRSGDTLRIGCGGLLIPTPLSPDDCMCLELDVLWPNQTSERYLGEIVGVILEESTHWMCVKLHAVPKETHDAIMHGTRPGAWVHVAS